jgi:hypothetical protein
MVTKLTNQKALGVAHPMIHKPNLNFLDNCSMHVDCDLLCYGAMQLAVFWENKSPSSSDFREAKNPDTSGM